MDIPDAASGVSLGQAATDADLGGTVVVAII